MKFMETNGCYLGCLYGDVLHGERVSAIARCDRVNVARREFVKRTVSGGTLRGCSRVNVMTVRNGDILRAINVKRKVGIVSKHTMCSISG